ncbi:LipA and NB-ARC domain protein [Moelleriella libera RCEF 2490]|uniref:LipA and NB-ARC domain protein n=1 Tax=Moelleriella libera RCEF 2490 TaxID=1081109 RepID=A0A168AQT8_9HYPO|nr:LipA and NB-ARC domain protein [Moelleriella libera RCEF 2490]
MHPSADVVARYGCSAVYKHPAAKVDIVLVHGLNGDPVKTWTSTGGVFWPSDLLPAALASHDDGDDEDGEKTTRPPACNIITYGYNADVFSTRHGTGSPSDNFIHQHAQTLVADLTMFRRAADTLRNPIVWVAHSLGGIVVKRALLYSNDVRHAPPAHHHHGGGDDDVRAVFLSTYAVVFLGTPHLGAGSAVGGWACVLQRIVDAVLPRRLFHSEPVLLRALRRDNETLADINCHFLHVYQRFRVHMVHECHKTDVKGTKITIVDADSASPQLPGVTYYGIEASHAEMCKFASPHAPGFRTMVTDIRQWLLDAPAVVAVRWAFEDREKRARALGDALECISPLFLPRASPSRLPSAALTPDSIAPTMFSLSNISALSLSTPHATAPRVARPASPDAMSLRSEASTLVDEIVDQLYKLHA